MHVIKLNAGNDKNGNPRRCFVVFYDRGDINKVINEGYRGYSALDDAIGSKNYGTV